MCARNPDGSTLLPLLLVYWQRRVDQGKQRLGDGVDLSFICRELQCLRATWHDIEPEDAELRMMGIFAEWSERGFTDIITTKFTTGDDDLYEEIVAPVCLQEDSEPVRAEIKLPSPVSVPVMTKERLAELSERRLGRDPSRVSQPVASNSDKPGSAMLLSSPRNSNSNSNNAASSPTQALLLPASMSGSQQTIANLLKQLTESKASERKWREAFVLQRQFEVEQNQLAAECQQQLMVSIIKLHALVDAVQKEKADLLAQASQGCKQHLETIARLRENVLELRRKNPTNRYAHANRYRPSKAVRASTIERLAWMRLTAKLNEAEVVAQAQRRQEAQAHVPVNAQVASMFDLDE